MSDSKHRRNEYCVRCDDTTWRNYTHDSESDTVVIQCEACGKVGRLPVWASQKYRGFPAEDKQEVE